MSADHSVGREEDLLAEQLRYYRDRAQEYDEWFERRGRYDRGSDHTSAWLDEIERIRIALEEFKPSGDVLEIACGTGLWTRHLVKHADGVTALDAAPEMIEQASARIVSIEPPIATVRFVEHDVYTWLPDRKYDVVFFGFFLSHVPPARFEAFWQLVDRALKPDGRVFFIDSRYTPESTATDHELRGPQATSVERSLADGRRYEIVKVFYDPDELARRLDALGWKIEVQESGEHFIFGMGGRTVVKATT